MRVLIAVTHLLGIGHLSRAALLGRGLAAAGHEVCLVSGGRPVPGIDLSSLDLVQLPPVHCRDADFRTLWGETGAPLDDALRAARRDALLDAFRRTRPDVVVTETYPFGRRALRHEFEALVEAVSARPERPALLASVRDILNPPSRPEKAAEAERVVLAHYDGVLVHGDPAAVPLEASWPVGERLRPRLLYTGYVSDETPVGETRRDREIVVSGGGGPAGLPLFRAAALASRSGGDATWRILVGHGVSQEAFRELAAAAHDRLVVERARPDFRHLLVHAAVSVSQSGYNTALDLAATGTPAVLVPFEEGSEREQRLRAEGLAASGRAVLLPVDQLSPGALAEAVERARALPPAAPGAIRMDGVAGSVARIEAAGERAHRAADAWRHLERRLDALADEGRKSLFWWRDDDAAEPSEALERLLHLRKRFAVPLALAVSPRLAADALARRLEREDEGLSVLVHGISHANHAPAGERKRELGFRPAAETLDGLEAGLADLRARFGVRALPVLVPPWNRIDAALIPELHGLGYRGLSCFGPREAATRDGLALANTHGDPIDWRAGGALRDEAETLDRLALALGSDEPVGLLTHHLVHDERIWRFTERLLALLSRHSGVRMVAAPEAFDIGQGQETAR